MKKILLFLMVFTLLLSAAEEKKGQKYYLKNCSACHGGGSRGGNLANIEEWKEYFKNDAKELIKQHKNEIDVINYLKSEKFKTKQSERMLKFLIEFAQDSPTIPSCNN